MREQKERDNRIRMQQEREALARVERLRKQKEYNGDIISAHDQKQLPVAFELVLETEPNSGQIVIEVDLMLVQYMKQHQVEGVRFLWSQVFESTHRVAASFDHESGQDRGGSGAILAHCMGLGKTFTTIALIHTLFRYPNLTHTHRTLILCPLNTAHKYDFFAASIASIHACTSISWKNEFRHWIGDLQPRIDIYLFSADDVAKKDRVGFLRRVSSAG